MLELLEEIVQREVVLPDLLLDLFGFLGVIDALRFLDQREHVAHAEDSRSHPVGIEGLQSVELLAHTDELDRAARDRLD